MWHPNGDGPKTDERKAVLIHLDHMSGKTNMSYLELVAIDPVSWALNHGEGNGKHYDGKVGGSDGVVAQVINEYTSKAGVDASVEVSDTKDNKNNVWYMMRMDPKSFIKSLLEWSCELSKDRTAWITQSEDDSIRIMEMSELKPYSKADGRTYHVTTGKSGVREVNYGGRISVLSNDLLTITQTKLHTAGISAVTGRYIDINDPQVRENVHVDDENTPKKINADITAKQGYTKPEETDWSTFITAVPEHNNGDVGYRYDTYMNGRARDWFMLLLSTVMRIRLDITGDPVFDSVKCLGRNTVRFNILDIENEPYFTDGTWILYGFKHIIKVHKSWTTHLSCYRMDHDASAKKYKAGT
jgi:hypothetical protein